MTGSEHYNEAERLLTIVSRQQDLLAAPDDPDGPDPEYDDWLERAALSIASAQVHATLALAALTVEVAGL